MDNCLIDRFDLIRPGKLHLPSRTGVHCRSEAYYWTFILRDPLMKGDSIAHIKQDRHDISVESNHVI